MDVLRPVRAVSGYVMDHITLSLVFCTLLFILYGVYLLALPRPLPGIPHRGTHRSIRGDIPAVFAFAKENKGGHLDWITSQCAALDSPLVQFFFMPFNAPMVVLNDFREAEDIATRRAADFDISPLTIALFSGALPGSTIAMPSHDLFKTQRRLWAGTMTTEFLHRVPAQAMFQASKDLLTLWRLKAKKAGKHLAFKAARDLRYTALDGIWKSALGSELGGLRAQIEALSEPSSVTYANTNKGKIKFATAPLSELCSSIDTVLEGMVEADGSWVPSLTRFMQKLRPAHRKALASKDGTMRGTLREARQKIACLSDEELESTPPMCAMEQVLQRERMTRAKAASDQSNLNKATSDDNMIDELFLWLVAGHETTVTALSWGLKQLAENVHVQRNFRKEVCRALGKKTVSSADEVLALDVPYLDATVWEILRVALTIPGIARIAVRDTEILGYPIPKGTMLFLSSAGFQSLDDTRYNVSEERRSKTSQAAKRKSYWAEKSLQDFDPERWLKDDEDGKTFFDMYAGPVLPFGGGPRGCFGRKLAMIELKIFLTQLLTTFEFQLVGDELNSYEIIERITQQPRQCYVRPKLI